MPDPQQEAARRQAILEQLLAHGTLPQQPVASHAQSPPSGPMGPTRIGPGKANPETKLGLLTTPVTGQMTDEEALEAVNQAGKIPPTPENTPFQPLALRLPPDAAGSLILKLREAIRKAGWERYDARHAAGLPRQGPGDISQAFDRLQVRHSGWHPSIVQQREATDEYANFLKLPEIADTVQGVVRSEVGDEPLKLWRGTETPFMHEWETGGARSFSANPRIAKNFQGNRGEIVRTEAAPPAILGPGSLNEAELLVDLERLPQEGTRVIRSGFKPRPNMDMATDMWADPSKRKAWAVYEKDTGRQLAQFSNQENANDYFEALLQADPTAWKRFEYDYVSLPPLDEVLRVNQPRPTGPVQLPTFGRPPLRLPNVGKPLQVGPWPANRHATPKPLMEMLAESFKK